MTTVKRLSILLMILMAAVQLRASSDELTHKVKEEIKHFFATRLQIESQNLRVTFVRLPDFCGLDPTCRIECYAQRALQRLGYQTIWVRVFQRGSFKLKMPVSVRVSVKQSVVIAKKNINFRSTIQPEDITVEERWIEDTDLYLYGLKDREEVIGKESAHFIPAGKLLLRKDVQERTLIKPGDRVEIRVRAGKLVVTSPGIARSAGKLGDFIYVKNTVTGKRLRAQVAESGVVVIGEARSL